MAEHDIMRTAKRVNVKERRPSAQDSLSTIYSTSPEVRERKIKKLEKLSER
jgi:hypothetical protein